MTVDVCLIATDAVSFNVLYRGQLEYLQRRGVRLTLICGGDQSELERLRDRHVGRVIDLGFVRRPSWHRDVVSLLRLIHHLVRHRYHVVLSTTPKAILLGSIASFISRQTNRIVFFQGRVYENASGVRRMLFSGLDWLAIRLSTRALFVSRSLLTAYAEEKLTCLERSQVIGTGSVNGVDIGLFNPDHFTEAERSALKNSLGIQDNQFVAISVGRICADKGLAELAGLAKTFAGNEITFLVVGDVEADFELDAAALFTLDNVRHVPFTRELPAYFAIADVHLFLTHREGFGNVALEAASCGVPTIGFDVVGVKDSLSDGVSGIRVPFADISQVEAAIVSFMQDRNKFRSRFSGARNWVAANYSHHRVWNCYADFLTSFAPVVANSDK